MNLGMLIPEFPGQTHAFFLREIAALEQLGFHVDIVSTRHPAKLLPHSTGMDITYLYPVRFGLCCKSLFYFFCRGPKKWWALTKCLWKSETGGIKDTLRLLGLAGLGMQLAYIAKKSSWDHLHVHFVADAANIGLFASIISDIPYSFTHHGHLDDFGRNQPLKWSQAKFAVVITKNLLQEAQRRLGEHIPSTVLIAPMGIDANTLTRTTAYPQWIPNTTCHLFVCARLNPVKGINDIIAALPLLDHMGIKSHLTIAGDEDSASVGYKKVLQNQVETLGLSQYVTFTGAISQDRVKSELEKAHVFILASHEEPLGVSIMEAMAMQVPVVATAGGGVPELIDQGKNGILVKPKNPHDIATAIAEILHNPEKTQAMVSLAHEKVTKHFHSGRSAEAIASQIRL